MKRILALILIIFCFASSVYAEIIPLDDEVKADLSKFGIITDFEIQRVNRAEAVKIILAMVGLNDIEQCDTVFTDVKKEYWASGYIDAAYSQGIINGNGDGTFAPEEKLTNEQFIKMLVCNLGYGPKVHAPYPTGYLIEANRLGITEGLALIGGDRATRSDVASMVFNALDTPMMVQIGFGTNQEFAIADGKHDTSYMTPRTILGDFSKKPVEDKNEIENDTLPQSPLFNGPEFTSRLIQIDNLKIKDGTISFTNSLDDKDKATYIIDENTYVYLTENTLPAEDIENGLYIQTWYKSDETDNIKLLKIQLWKKSAIIVN